jgi:hypothetical protein
MSPSPSIRGRTRVRIGEQGLVRWSGSRSHDG